MALDPNRIFSAIFAFSHPFNFSVIHPVSPGEGSAECRLCRLWVHEPCRHNRRY